MRCIFSAFQRVALLNKLYSFICYLLQYDPFAEHRPQKISDREDEYKKRRQKMIISPERHDPFADGKFSHHPFLSLLHVFMPISIYPTLEVLVQTVLDVP